jgi:hypothetical protein
MKGSFPGMRIRPPVAGAYVQMTAHPEFGDPKRQQALRALFPHWRRYTAAQG